MLLRIELRSSVAEIEARPSAVIGILHNPHSAALLLALRFTADDLSTLNLRHEAFQVHLGLHSSAVGESRPAPLVPPLGISAGSEECPEDQQITVAARKMQSSVAVEISGLHGLFRAVGRIRQQNLQHGIVAAAAGFHDGISPVRIPSVYDFGVPLTEEVDDLGAAGAGCEHESRLVFLVQRRVGVFVTEVDEDAADFDMAEESGEVEVRVGEAFRGGIGAVEGLGVRVEDSLDERCVVGDDRPANTGRCFDPRRRESAVVKRVAWVDCEGEYGHLGVEWGWLPAVVRGRIASRSRLQLDRSKCNGTESQ